MRVEKQDSALSAVGEPAFCPVCENKYCKDCYRTPRLICHEHPERLAPLKAQAGHAGDTVPTTAGNQPPPPPSPAAISWAWYNPMRWLEPLINPPTPAAVANPPPDNKRHATPLRLFRLRGKHHPYLPFRIRCAACRKSYVPPPKKKKKALPLVYPLH